MVLGAVLSVVMLTQELSAREAMIQEAKALGETLYKAQLCNAVDGLQIDDQARRVRIQDYLQRARAAGMTPQEFQHEIESTALIEMAALATISGVDMDSRNPQQAFADAGLTDYVREACAEVLASHPDMFKPKSSAD